MSRPTDVYSLESCPKDYTVQRGNAGYASPGQTVVKYNLDQVDMTTGRTVPLLVVPAGKIFFVTDLSIDHDGNTAVRIALSIGGPGATNLVTIFSVPTKGDTAPTNLAGIETQWDVPQGSTLYVTWAATAGVNFYLNMSGIQQGIGAQ